MSDSTTTPSTAPDWTMGGKKPEREGQRCANEECGQILMLVRSGRKFCAHCDSVAGRDPHAWAAGAGSADTDDAIIDARR